MGKKIWAVVVGYITIFALVFVGLAIAWRLLGADRALQPGSYDVSGLWLVVSLIVGLVAALVAGGMAERVSPGAPKILALVVVILGIVFAIPVFTAGGGEPTVREGAVTMTEAMMESRTPVWFSLVNIVVGVAGVLLGGKAVAGK